MISGSVIIMPFDRCPHQLLLSVRCETYHGMPV